MNRKKLLWQIYPSYILVTLLSLLIFSGYATKTFKDLYVKSTPQTEFFLHELYLRLWIGAFLVALMSAGISYWISRKISQPLESLRESAKKLSEGDFLMTFPSSDLEEIHTLQESMSTMAGEIKDRIETIVQQQKEHETVLSSMVEGVVAVDMEFKIININQVARQMLEVTIFPIKGKNLMELIRNRDLYNLVEKILKSGKSVGGEIVLRREQERALEAHGVPLRDGMGRQMGVLVVIHDVTRLKKLEKIRQDFVANVSHELKTPITSIKGAVETLLDGAIHSPEDVDRFLKMISRQADRLDLIIEDLLSLSRIEQERERKIFLQEHPLQEVLQSALQTCEFKAREKKISLELKCPPGLRGFIHSQLLEQAVVNLIDNAIKYSPDQGVVRISAEKDDSLLVIEVEDHGIGIPSEHLNRIFERFYRVDKARSRKMGGTGLGLSIVKHIALAHNGEIQVQSQPGKGSIFSLVIPQMENPLI